MKIRIKSEPYLKCPAPKLTKKLFDWFWGTFWKLHLSNYVDCIETIDIRLNQALPYDAIHFYIKVNGTTELHRSVDNWTVERYAKEKLENRERAKKFQRKNTTNERCLLQVLEIFEPQTIK